MATYEKILQRIADHNNELYGGQAFFDNVLIEHFGPTGDPEP